MRKTLHKTLTSADLPLGCDALPPRARRIAVALLRSGGVLADAAQQLGITRQSVAAACKRHAELDEVRKLAMESIKDCGESQLFRAVRRGRAWAIRYLLSRRAKDRGYADAMHLDGDGLSSNVQLVVVPPKAKSDAAWERQAQADEAAIRKREERAMRGAATEI